MKSKKAKQNNQLRQKEGVTVAQANIKLSPTRPLDLETVLESVRLIPPGGQDVTEFPAQPFSQLSPDEVTANLLAGLQQLPESLRLHLLECMNPATWETRDPNEPLAYQQRDRVLMRFYEIVYWHKNLRELVEQKNLIRVAAEVRPDKKGRARFYFHDRFIAALTGINLHLLRKCVVCEHIFLAKRGNQSGCSPRCAKTFRKRQERENARNKARGIVK